MSEDGKHSKDLLVLDEKAYPVQLDIVSEKVVPQKSAKPNISKPLPSAVLSRVQAFLPQMKKANADLEQRLSSESAEKFDIENVEGDERYIEMDLAVVPQGDSSSDESDGSDDSDSEPCIGEVTEANFKTCSQKTKRPVIEVMEQSEKLNEQHDKGVP